MAEAEETPPIWAAVVPCCKAALTDRWNCIALSVWVRRWVIGYSINDTIVVFDRIRENFRKLRDTPVVATINVSLSETLGRTLVTSLTTVQMLAALALFGGDMIC